jgi:subtilisin family serine protease
MAAPHVAGALAVLLSTGLVPQEAIERLLATAVDLGDPGPDDRYGAGRLDLDAAVRADAAERRVPWATISVAIVGLLGAVIVVRRARHRPEPG